MSSRPEQGTKGIDKLREIFRHELQPIQTSLQDLNRSFKAQQDLLLVEFTKMHVPHCKSMTQADGLPRIVSRQINHSETVADTY
jgi:hypothetical protein